MIVLIQTDLPEPVVPAIRRWGIFARSNVAISPDVVFPTARERMESGGWELHLGSGSFGND